MKNLSEMKNDVKLKLDIEFQSKVKKYRGFMNLLSNCLSTVVPTSMFDDIASYINGKSEKIIRLRYHDEGIHYNYIDVATDDSLKELKIDAFRAHDAYYNPRVNFASNDKKIVDFFNSEFSRFEEWLTCNGTVSIKKLVRAINDGIYNKYDFEFRKLNINEYNFADSDYALKLGEFEEEIVSKIRTLCEESGLKL